MLIAHAVPSYFFIQLTQSSWDDTWSRPQCWLLNGVALGSTVLPDADVVYNILVRGFANHSTLWTHSVWVYGIFGLMSLLCTIGRWRYIAWCLGLVAVGGFSHILLDALVHNTPMFYPLSLDMIGLAPESVVEGGISAYIQHPLFLLEIGLWGAVLIHWVHQRRLIFDL